MKVKAKKIKNDEYQITYTLCESDIHHKLNSVNEKIQSLERSIEMYGKQLILLKEERDQINLTILDSDQI